MKGLGFTTYQLWIASLYVALVPLFFLQEKMLSLGLQRAGDTDPIYLFSASIVLFFLFLYSRGKFKKVSKRLFLLVLVYGLLIAVAEEILFRGFIQQEFQHLFFPAFAILLSSLIFGAAHLPNGAKGWRPRKWSWSFARYAFIVGIPLGTLFYLTGGLVMPIILHTCFVVGIRLWIPSR